MSLTLTTVAKWVAERVRNCSQHAKPFQAGLCVLFHTLLLLILYGSIRPQDTQTLIGCFQRKPIATSALLKRNRLVRNLGLDHAQKEKLVVITPAQAGQSSGCHVCGSSCRCQCKNRTTIRDTFFTFVLLLDGDNSRLIDQVACT
jgi:hypothetical protein